MSLLRHLLPLFTKYSVLQVETHLRMMVEFSQNRIWRACRFGHTLRHAFTKYGVLQVETHFRKSQGQRKHQAFYQHVTLFVHRARGASTWAEKIRFPWGSRCLRLTHSLSGSGDFTRGVPTGWRCKVFFLQWIHPCDCNGRTARLVTSALLIQEGVVPALEAHVFAQNKSYGDASTYDGMLFHQLNLSAVFQTC